MRREVTAILTTVALVLAGKSAQSCGSTHIATTGTSAADAGCIFNVNVSADSMFRDSIETGFYNGEQGLVDQIGGALAGLGADGGTVDFSTVDGQVTFEVPAGAKEVTITLTNDGNMEGWHQVSVDAGWTAGAQASTTYVLENGQWQAQATAPAQDPCAPAQAIAPPPLTTADPGPATDPGSAEPALNPDGAAVDAQLQGNLPLAGESGNSRARRLLRVQ